ncbi:lipid-A-disaccharide synthase [bacterium]|nr:lipid-A-disaccharide synthase [bacterium]
MHVFWVAGEASGDRHAARLIDALNETGAGWTHSGMGGPKMQEAGCRAVADISEMSVMGLVEVIRHLPRIFRLRDRLLEQIREQQPDLVVLVDLPDFNLALLKKLRREFGRTLRVMYFISPQVWAWRRGRARTMAAQLNAMAVLFPFEVDFYERYGLETVYFGHPLAGEVAPSADRATLRREFELSDGLEAVALMPGSRSHEVERHLPVQLAAVERYRQLHPNVQALVVLARGIPQTLVDELVEDRPWVTIVNRRAYDALHAADAALVKSGTSTVEAALIGTPFVVMYIVSGTTYFLARLLIKGVKHIAMVNVLAGRGLVRERIQFDAGPKRLAEDLEDLREGPYREEVIQGLSEVADLLGQPGAMKRLACWMVERFGETP